MRDINGLKLGVVHAQLYPQTMSGEGPVVETAGAIAAEASVKAIEISHVRDELTRARLRQLLQSGGLKVIFNAESMILRHKWDLSAESESARQEAVAGLRGLMDEANFMGAGLFVVMSGPDTAPEGRAAAKARLAESLKKLCEEGGKLGLSVSLEPFDREVDKKCLIGPTSEAVEVAKAVKKDNFGLSLDLSHILLLRESPGEAVSQAKNFILHAQISNCVMAEGNPVRGDMHPAFGTEGSLAGAEQAAEFLRALEKSGFFKKPGSGFVSLEVRPREEEYSSVVLSGALRFLSSALEKL